MFVDELRRDSLDQHLRWNVPQAHRTSSSLSSLSPTSSFASLSSVISTRDEAFQEAVDDIKTGPTLLVQ